MAATPTPRPTPAEPAAAAPRTTATATNPALAALAALNASAEPPGLPVGVAYSGGADSTALLYAAAAQWPGQVRALHVNHGLQPAADSFVQVCERSCHTLRVPLQVRHVDARHATGESPQDAARRARYAALARAAAEAGLGAVLLAQHADDQAETLLLALARGAGVAGLAAMGPRMERGGVLFLRPLLGLRGSSLRDWAQVTGVEFVDDPSNASTAYTRNRIRHELLPALERSFPQFRDTFARSARHAAQAQTLLVELAQSDLAGMHGEPAIASLQALSPARQANLLRHWLRAVHGSAASTAQLDELLAQIADCTTRGHGLRLRVGAGTVLRDGPRLRFEQG